MVLLLFSCPVMSSSLQPHGLQHARPPCPSPSPEVCPSSCSLHQLRILEVKRSCSLPENGERLQIESTFIRTSVASVEATSQWSFTLNIRGKKMVSNPELFSFSTRQTIKWSVGKESNYVQKCMDLVNIPCQ